jgi:Domain of unknown function (DUF5667)
LFGWVGFTAQAAETALPGDSLYSFKTGIEQVQISLAGDLDRQADLYLEFASHRLLEINKLVDSGRYQKAVAASEKIRLNIQRALEIMDKLEKVDPAKAAQRQFLLDAQLARFTAQINDLLLKLPPAFQPAFSNLLPPIQSEGSTPATPLVTRTPNPDIEQAVPVEDNTSQEDNLNDDTATGDNKGSGKDSEKEKGTEKSSENDSEADPKRDQAVTTTITTPQALKRHMNVRM